MINIMKQSNNTSAYVIEYVADEEADVAKLPTNVAPGSICLVVATSQVFMLNNKKEWIEL